MKRMQLYVRALFGFSRMETNGFLVLIPLTLLLLFSEPLYHAFQPDTPITGIDRTDSLLAWLERQQAPLSHDSIFFQHFDPNTLSREGYVKFGLQDRIADRIARYREKGGRFRRKEDVAKIFGMDSSWYARAKVWMRIPPVESPVKGRMVHTQRVTRSDINQADTTQLQDVYGIGPTLARRIVMFRDRLGGFVTMDQLREVYGLDSTVVDRVKRQFEVKMNFEPRRLNVNTVTLEELNRHPYVSRRQAQAIFAYRAQHAPIDSLGQLAGIPLLDDAWRKKMRPYLVFPSQMR